MDGANVTIFNDTITFCNNSINCLNTTTETHRYVPQYHTLVQEIIIFVTGTLLSTITISGNALVCFAYYSNRRLQTITKLIYMLFGGNRYVCWSFLQFLFLRHTMHLDIGRLMLLFAIYGYVWITLYVPPLLFT